MDENMKFLEEKVQDHEDRLRKIEEHSMEQKFQLLNIEKSQSDLKLLVIEQNDRLIKQITINSNVSNEIKLIDRKETWAVVALVLGLTSPYILKFIFGY